jgi:hypothetical protein
VPARDKLRQAQRAESRLRRPSLIFFRAAEIPGQHCNQMPVILQAVEPLGR